MQPAAVATLGSELVHLPVPVVGEPVNLIVEPTLTTLLPEILTAVLHVAFSLVTHILACALPAPSIVPTTI